MSQETLTTDVSHAALAAHREFLHEVVFQTQSKWPHFKLLLTDIEQLANELAINEVAVSLERTYLYGGFSLFAPFFSGKQFISVDCQTKTAAARGGYQQQWLDDARCLRIPSDIEANVTMTTLPDSCADVLMAPNLIHHVQDQEGMFAEFNRLLKPGGRGYIFEALVRELHQIPDDYLRYTPWGIETMLNRHGMQMTKWQPAGGPFEAIAYCWVQALQYIPESERAEKEQWFYQQHFPELMRLDSQYPQNHHRAHTSFPVGFNIFFTKPNATG